MEFYNVKLLPKGLPEIIAQFTPDNIYSETKVIVHSRKLVKRLHGTAGWHDLTSSYNVNLWPTTICFIPKGSGTYSFRLWFSLLSVALHEIGHLATQYIVNAFSAQEYELHGDAWRIVEDAADNFAKKAMERIAEVDPRLGQPLGALTGYPGILAFRRRQGNFQQINFPRINECRALKCDAQVAIGDIIGQLMGQFQFYDGSQSYKVLYPIVNRILHAQARQLGIDRYFTNRAGKRYLMFNYREANQIVDACIPTIKRMHLKLNLRNLYKKFGNLTEAEKQDPVILAWNEIHRKTVCDGIQRPLDLRISFDPQCRGGLEPEDIPF